MLLAALMLVSGAAFGQRAALQEEERVTAVDVLIELDADAEGGRGKVRSLPKDLGSEDFEVRIDGQLQPVISFLDRRTSDDAVTEPWTIVLYFDLNLTEPDTVRWATAELSERVQQLVELGEVELVVAKDSTTRALAPTRDAELLEWELAGMWIDPAGVHQVIELRSQVLAALRQSSDSVDAAEFARAAVAEEVVLVGRHLDELLIHLLGREAPGSKRALFWVSDGFDLEPASFYQTQGIELGSGAPNLIDRSAELAATLASYGWVTFSLTPPPAGPGLVPGFRLGKWLFRPRMPRGLIGGTLTREERRDPAAARAYIDLGRAHLESGDPESARQAFEQALYHFAGDPRTSKDQAAAKAGLGIALEALGEIGRARRAFRHAVELDPDLAPRYPQSQPRLLKPLACQQVLASDTAGRTVEDREALAEAVGSLSRRARLTYQISGSPRGSLRNLEVALVGSRLGLRYPSRARSGTPQTVAEARARQLLADDLEDGDLSVRAELEPQPEGTQALWVALDRGTLIGGERRDRPIELRLTVAMGPPDGVASVEHERFEIAGKPGPRETRHRTFIDSSGENDWVAVIVEDIETGRWGADLVD